VAASTQVTQGALRCRLAAAAFWRSHASDDWAAITLYAAKGRLIPLSVNSPTGSTFTASSMAISTRGVRRICPGFASSQSREATLGVIVLLWLGYRVLPVLQ
jgi:hypothetical protein